MISPRLPQSQAWTKLPDDFKKQVLELFKEHFKEAAKKGNFILEGRIFKNEIIIRCGYTEKNKIKPIQFDMSVDYDSSQAALGYFETLVDLAASLFETYFDNPKEEFPQDWLKIEFNEKTVFIKQDSTNMDLEAQANAILGEMSGDSSELIHGDLDNDGITEAMESLNNKKRH